MAKNILLIGGSLNQTTQMHKIAQELSNYNCFFTPFYTDGVLTYPRKMGLMDRTIAGFGNFYRDTMSYFERHKLPVDPEGRGRDYDLVLTCTDLFVQNNIRDKKVVLVQEGMTDPMNWWLRVVQSVGLPNWLAINTAATGLSDAYNYFCVASEGYRDHFVKVGVRPEKIKVTGIPNYDCAEHYLDNDFPHKGYVLVATSDTREALKYEDRKATIERAVQIAAGRQLIFKLHPNEDKERATREINQYAPGALVYPSWNVHEMIANCDVLITKFSTVVYTGIALGKEVYSDFDMETLKRLTPIQNQGTSSKKIAELCGSLLAQ